MSIKRYDAYAGCNTSMDQIARERGDGEWVKLEDLAESLGLPSTEELDAANKRIEQLEAANRELLSALTGVVTICVLDRDKFCHDDQDIIDESKWILDKANGGANT